MERADDTKMLVLSQRVRCHRSTPTKKVRLLKGKAKGETVRQTGVVYTELSPVYASLAY